MHLSCHSRQLKRMQIWLAEHKRGILGISIRLLSYAFSHDICFLSGRCAASEISIWGQGTRSYVLSGEKLHTSPSNKWDKVNMLVKNPLLNYLWQESWFKKVKYSSNNRLKTNFHRGPSIGPDYQLVLGNLIVCIFLYDRLRVKMQKWSIKEQVNHSFP